MKKQLLCVVALLCVQQMVMPMEADTITCLAQVLRRAIRDNDAQTVTAMVQAAPALLTYYGKPTGFYEEVAAVHVAALYGHKKSLEALLKNGADANMETECKNAPLHYVSTVKAAQLLIKHKALYDKKNEQGETPFSYAVLHKYPVYSSKRMLFKNCYEVASALLDKGADINTVDVCSASCLDRALYKDSADAVEFLLSNNADVDVRYKQGLTPFEYALGRSPQRIVRVFEKHGMMFFPIGIDEKSDPFILLSHNASSFKKVMATEPESEIGKKAINNVARLLSGVSSKRPVSERYLSHGILWNRNGWHLKGVTRKTLELFWGIKTVDYAYSVVTNVCKKVLEHVNANDYQSLKQFYKDYPLLTTYNFCITEDILNTLYVAVKNGYVECLHILLKHIESKFLDYPFSFFAKSLLHVAIDCDNEAIIKLLVKHHPRFMDLHDRDQRTPYQYAKDKNKAQIVALLDKIIINSLSTAIQKNDYKQCKKLLKQKSNLTVLPAEENANEVSTIMHVASRSNPKKAKVFIPLLVAAGADVNAFDVNGLTPLYDAVVDSRLANAEVLLKAGACIDIKASPDHCTPLSAALYQRNYPMIALMVRYQQDAIAEMLAIAEDDEVRNMLQEYKQ